MGRKSLIVYERCPGLYRDDDGEIAKCEHPIGHLPTCGPDRSAIPYKPPKPATKSRALASVAMIDGIQRGGSGFGRISANKAAVLLALAALWDESGRPIHQDDIAAHLHIAPGTAARHLRESPLAVKSKYPGAWLPASTTEQPPKTVEKYVCKCGAETHEEHMAKVLNGYGGHLFEVNLRRFPVEAGQ